MTRLTFANITPARVFNSSGYDLYYTAGNVGIGIASPTVALDVSGATRLLGTTTICGSTVTRAITSSSATVLGLTTICGSTITRDISATTITLSGALNAPSATLTGAINAASATLTGAMNSASASLTGALSVTGNSTHTGTSALIGNVSIGKTNPNLPLDVSGASQITGDTTICGTLYVRQVVGLSSQWSSGANSSLYYSGGSVGVGKTDPSSVTAMDVNGILRISQPFQMTSYPAFHLQRSTASDATITASSNLVSAFNNEIYNMGNVLDASNNFRPSIPGFYQVSIVFGGSAIDKDVTMRRDASNSTGGQLITKTSNASSCTLSAIVYLNGTQHVSVWTATGVSVVIKQGMSYMGHLLYATTNPPLKANGSAMASMVTGI
jgi:hypothetical protein